MQKRPFQSRQLVDGFLSFGQGVNAGIDPILLPKTQMASAVNTTVRGDFVRPRPKFRKINLQFPAYGYFSTQSTFEGGKFQGSCYYNPDSGTDSLMASISGHLFRVAISGNYGYVTDESIPGDLNDPTQDTAWLIQAEKWVIVTDGTFKAPLFFDGTSTVRSNGASNITYQSTISSFSIPAVGQDTPAITLGSAFTGSNGDVINVKSAGGFIVKSGSPGPGGIVLTNLNAKPVGSVVKANTQVTWTALGNELPPGRQMAYGLGRVWEAMLDGKQFLAGDLVGGSSGTVANNFRDAVLNITENNYLLGGGLFTVPGNYGDIHAMCFSETEDTSLGQGALQIFTPKQAFSCNAPVDRTTWQSITNPILTESMKGHGGLSQYGTINANSDIHSRDPNGIVSQILARREFNTWGNTPISREVQPQIDRDSQDLLRFESAVEFDNRELRTTEGVLSDRGVYWQRLFALNFDPNSNLGGKSPSVYDALYWSGLNIFQLVKGNFGTEERCFAFTLNNFTDKIEVWEILKSNNPAVYDNDDANNRVVWSFDTYLDFDQKDPRNRDRLRLDNGEIIVDELVGKVDFQAYYRPDDWPCWVPWFAWQECAANDVPLGQPGFRPNMGLGEPNPQACDPVNNRPLREGYGFHFKLVVTGQCRIKGGRFGAYTMPQPEWSPQSCNPTCPQPIAINEQLPANNQFPADKVFTVLGDSSSNILSDGSGDLLGG